MKKAKVSVIMPCYNGEATIARAIRGVIQQTYRPIQFILVNDGSTDGSDRVIRSVQHEIEQAGIEFVYHVQQNLGLGGAINSGLKFVNGEYLAWIDADDELLPESVKLRVELLETHPEYGSVSSDAIMVEDSDWDKPLGNVAYNPEENSQPDQFLAMLLGRSIFCPGCHLVRTEVFRSANGGMEIYPARHGQNWQMLLPVYYASKHAYLDVPLYKYRTNADNMSAEMGKMPMNQLCLRRQEYLAIVKNTLKRITGLREKEKSTYLSLFKKYIYALNLDSALEKQDQSAILKWKVAVKWMNMVVGEASLHRSGWENTENHR